MTRFVEIAGMMIDVSQITCVGSPGKRFCHDDVSMVVDVMVKYGRWINLSRHPTIDEKVDEKYVMVKRDSDPYTSDGKTVWPIAYTCDDVLHVPSEFILLIEKNFHDEVEELKSVWMKYHAGSVKRLSSPPYRP